MFPNFQGLVFVRKYLGAAIFFIFLTSSALIGDVDEKIFILEGEIFGPNLRNVGLWVPKEKVEIKDVILGNYDSKFQYFNKSVNFLKGVKVAWAKVNKGSTFFVEIPRDLGRNIDLTVQENEVFSEHINDTKSDTVNLVSFHPELKPLI